MRVIQFEQKLEGFIGDIEIDEVNVAENLLEEGLAYVDDSWYVPAVFHQK